MLKSPFSLSQVEGVGLGNEKVGGENVKEGWASRKERGGGDGGRHLTHTPPWLIYPHDGSRGAPSELDEAGDPLESLKPLTDPRHQPCWKYVRRCVDLRRKLTISSDIGKSWPIRPAQHQQTRKNPVSFFCMPSTSARTRPQFQLQLIHQCEPLT